MATQRLRLGPGALKSTSAPRQVAGLPQGKRRLSHATATYAANRTAMALNSAQTVTIPQVPQFETAVEGAGQGARAGPIGVERPDVAHMTGEARQALGGVHAPEGEAAVVRAAQRPAALGLPLRGDRTHGAIVSEQDLRLRGARLLGCCCSAGARPCGGGCLAQVPVNEVPVFETADGAHADAIDRHSGHGGARGLRCLRSRGEVHELGSC
mmetsp:Transcript_10513/g.30018  ORF Transcript_10513/g.30018 Transcript_10513/m.30018 type:complete len:211 (+) Transcript_10513:16-648(+)